MIRISKILGIACVAMVCMAAPALAAEFHSESASTTLSGPQTTTNVFGSDSGAFHCSTVNFNGSMSGTTTSKAVVNPTYSGCQTTGFIEANITVDTNGCDYNITAGGSIHFEGCNAGASGIVMTMPFCTITIKSGQTLNSVSFTNGGSGATREITMNLEISNIAYSESGFACKNSGTNTTGGTFSGSILFTGTSGGSHTGIRWE